MSTDANRAPLVLGLAACAIVIAGSFGPWATAGIFSEGGFDGGDAYVTLGAGLVAMVAVVLERLLWLVAAAGALCLWSGWANWSDVANTEIFGRTLDPGWGLVAVTVGGGALFLWAAASWFGWWPK